MKYRIKAKIIKKKKKTKLRKTFYYKIKYFIIFKKDGIIKLYNFLFQKKFSKKIIYLFLLKKTIYFFVFHISSISYI